MSKRHAVIVASRIARCPLWFGFVVALKRYAMEGDDRDSDGGRKSWVFQSEPAHRTPEMKTPLGEN